MVSTVTVAESPGCASEPGVTSTSPLSSTVTVQFALPLLFGSSVIVAVVVEPAGISSPVLGTTTLFPSSALVSSHLGSYSSLSGVSTVTRSVVWSLSLSGAPAVTSNSSPPLSGLLTGTSKLPSSSETPCPITVPSVSLTVTDVCGSVLPETVSSPFLGVFTDSSGPLKSLASFGFVPRSSSTLSLIPSPSESGSLTSAVPSPSVSR